MITGTCVILLSGIVATAPPAAAQEPVEVCVRLDGTVEYSGPIDAAARLFWDKVTEVARQSPFLCQRMP